MSANGTKQTWIPLLIMSAVEGKADIAESTIECPLLTQRSFGVERAYRTIDLCQALPVAMAEAISCPIAKRLFPTLCEPFHLITSG
jgi:hypothetical protein